MANVPSRVDWADKEPFANEKKRCTKYTATNSSCNNSIKLCVVRFVENSSKTQLDINAKIANIPVTRNVMAK